jgi:hypothetical protein
MELLLAALPENRSTSSKKRSVSHHRLNEIDAVYPEISHLAKGALDLMSRSDCGS